MLLTYLQAKIHNATVSGRNLDYHGSLTLDEELLDAAGMRMGQQIQVYNANNGARFETYLLRGERGRRQVEVNGAAARLVEMGDPVIICTYVQLTPDEAKGWRPKVVMVDDKNGITETFFYS